MDAVLADLAKPGDEGSEFASALLDRVYKGHLLLLLGLRQKKRRIYHRLMHSICKLVT